MNVTIAPKKNLHGTVSVPGDKSISHRSIMLGAIAKGESRITGFLMGEDCLSTIACFQKLGIDISVSPKLVTLFGKGRFGLHAPSSLLDVGNSGTTLRLLSGILAGQNFNSKITGDSSIQKRPMNRVAVPLGQMGAEFIPENDLQNGLFAPFTIVGHGLKSISYTMPIASAQVKSALLLASLYADGETVITEPILSRDHTEIMLSHMGADIYNENGIIHCSGENELHGQEISIPGDISSAAYFLVAASICPGSEIILKNVGINPSRTGIIDALKNMGADIELLSTNKSGGELSGDILVKSAELKGTTIEGAHIPRLIDEIPILAVAACFAEGKTIIRDAGELKVKESNRIHTVAVELNKFGANIQETADGLVITGGLPLSGCVIESYNDHRIAMSMAVAALGATGSTCITGSECTDISFPAFYRVLSQL